jgi:hypothetical protein
VTIVHFRNVTRLTVSCACAHPMPRLAWLVVALAFALPAPARPADCRDRTGGDICAAGSPWLDYTRFRLHLRADGHEGTTTITMHGGDDFSVDIEDTPDMHGQIIVVAGRVMLMRDVPHDEGYEIDALDGPVLMHQLVATLLGQAFPGGPGSVTSDSTVRVVQKTRPIRIATPSAGGRLGAPWTLTGTVHRAAGTIDFDLLFDFTDEHTVHALAFSGTWEKAAAAPALDEHMPLDGWAIHWLGPIASSSADGTVVDFSARPTSDRWPDLAALRKSLAAADRRARH